MRAVVDTNVLVSALINPSGAPGRLVDEIRTLALTPVVNAAILAAYTEVLRRPRFNFPDRQVRALLDVLSALALHVRPDPVVPVDLPDPGDAPFMATALAAGCPIVTGNVRHFPADCGARILSPA